MPPLYGAACFGRIDHSQIILNAQGEIMRRDLEEAAAHFSDFITIRSSVIMPDHLHLRFTWRSGHAAALRIIGQFIGRFKQLSQYHIAGHAASIWQPGHHDIISLSERCNRTIDAYIANNPLKEWLMHCDKTLMHVREPFYLPEGAGSDDLWRAVGNFALLGRPRLVALRISRQVPESALDELTTLCVRGALEKGYVYVSTFFSPGEHRVFSALAPRAEIPLIRLIPTHMDLAYRPHGAEPLLFASRRLLVLSRMPNPDAAPSRGELLELNRIAAALARATPGGKSLYVMPAREGQASRLRFISE